MPTPGEREKTAPYLLPTLLIPIAILVPLFAYHGWFRGCANTEPSPLDPGTDVQRQKFLGGIAADVAKFGPPAKTPEEGAADELAAHRAAVEACAEHAI